METINSEYNKALIQQANLLASATKTMQELLTNISCFFQDLSKFIDKKNEMQNQNMKAFEHYCGKITQYIDHVHQEIPTLIDGNIRN